MSEALAQGPASSRYLVQYHALLLGMHLIHITPNPAEEQSLEEANLSLRDTRRICRYRPNVRQDALADPEAVYRSEVMNVIEEQVNAEDWFDVNNLADLAAMASFMEVGECQKQVALAMVLHAAQLQPGDRLQARIQAGVRNPHGWLELHRPGQRTVILDPWGEAPPHLEDQSGKQGQPSLLQKSLTLTDAPVFRARYQRTLDTLRSDWSAYRDEGLQMYRERGIELPEDDPNWEDPTPMLAPGFVDQVSEAVGRAVEDEALDEPLSRSQEWVRQKGLNTPEAEAHAQSVLEMAKDLNQVPQNQT